METNKVLKKINEFKKPYEGINIADDGSIDLIDPNPCWEGYVAIGTKIVNGKEVPNCVPED